MASAAKRMVDAGPWRIARKDETEFFAANFCARIIGDNRRGGAPSSGARRQKSTAPAFGRKNFHLPAGSWCPLSFGRAELQLKKSGGRSHARSSILSRSLHRRDSQRRAHHHRCRHVHHRVHRPGRPRSDQRGHHHQQLRRLRTTVRRPAGGFSAELCRPGFLSERRQHRDHRPRASSRCRMVRTWLRPRP